jgi:hypothetical protein
MNQIHHAGTDQFGGVVAQHREVRAQVDNLSGLVGLDDQVVAARRDRLEAAKVRGQGEGGLLPAAPHRLDCIGDLEQREREPGDRPGKEGRR